MKEKRKRRRGREKRKKMRAKIEINISGFLRQEPLEKGCKEISSKPFEREIFEHSERGHCNIVHESDRRFMQHINHTDILLQSLNGQL